MLVVLAERHLHQPPAGFAWLIGAIGVGALLVPLIPNAFARDYRNARWLFVPYVIRGVGDVLIAVLTPFPVALVILFVYGLNTSTGMVVFNSTIQGAIPEAMRGRVFTLLDVDWSAFQLASLAVAAVIVDRLGGRAALLDRRHALGRRGPARPDSLPRDSIRRQRRHVGPSCDARSGRSGAAFPNVLDAMPSALRISAVGAKVLPPSAAGRSARECVPRR